MRGRWRFNPGDSTQSKEQPSRISTRRVVVHDAIMFFVLVSIPPYMFKFMTSALYLIHVQIHDICASARLSFKY